MLANGVDVSAPGRLSVRYYSTGAQMSILGVKNAPLRYKLQH